MYDNGYLSKNRSRPSVMVGVVAIHAAGLAGLMLFAPQFTRLVETTLEGRNIPLPPDPLPLPDDARPTVKTKLADTRPTVRKTTVTPDTTKTDLTFDLGTAGDLGTGRGSELDFKPVEPVRDPVVVLPRLVGRNAQPPYPPGMQRLNMEGRVTVRVLVGIDGRPLRVEAVKVDQDAFFKATRDWAMSHWRFAPATRDGVPFEEWRTMTVTFRMNE